MSTKNIYRPQTKIDYSTYLYILPAFIFYIIFVLFPLADTFLNSFTQWNGISEKKWVGLDQYINNLQNKKITSSIKHSFILIVFYSFLPIIIGLLIAGIMICSKKSSSPSLTKLKSGTKLTKQKNVIKPPKFLTP